MGSKTSPHDPLVSPGECSDLSWWKRASRTGGWSFLYGSEEVLRQENRNLIEKLKKTGATDDLYEEHGPIHASPVAALYLGEKKDAAAWITRQCDSDEEKTYQQGDS